MTKVQRVMYAVALLAAVLVLFTDVFFWRP